MSNCDCNNNCEAVAGLNEAAANLIQYSKLINSWLNGGSNQTVNVGGTNIPTLLGLACEIRQLVGVWPDGLTIKMDPANKKIYVPLKPNSGVHVGNQGLYIDSSDFLQLGGGLAKDSSGNIYVDFDQMPTTKFDSILETFRKGLRLPKWLTANTNFYVDKNHANASDTIDDTRGLSPSKPFKTIQACVNYVTENFNLGNFDATILVNGNALYPEKLVLGDYSRNTGSIRILPYNTDTEFINLTPSLKDYLHHCIFCTGGLWSVVRAKFLLNLNYSGFVPEDNPNASYYSLQLIDIEGGTLYLSQPIADINLSGAPGKNVSPQLFYAGGANSNLVISPGYGSPNINLKNNTSGSNKISASCFYAANKGNITFSSRVSAIEAEKTFYLGGSYGKVAVATSGGNITINQAPNSINSFIEVSGNPVTGKRYECTGGGYIDVKNLGPDFFPGSTAGTVDSSTFSWYK